MIINWDNAAARDGYRIDYHPTVGSIAQSDAGYYGHVAFVEELYDMLKFLDLH
jgi:surface antigen